MAMCGSGGLWVTPREELLPSPCLSPQSLAGDTAGVLGTQEELAERGREEGCAARHCRVCGVLGWNQPWLCPLPGLSSE